MRPEDRAFIDGLKAKQKQTMFYGVPVRQVERIPTFADWARDTSERNLRTLYDRCCHGKRWRPLFSRGDPWLEVLAQANPLLDDLVFTDARPGAVNYVRTGLPSVSFRR